MRRRQAFGLIEVIIGLAILVILATTSFILYGKRPIEEAEKSTVVHNIEEIRKAEVSYKLVEDTFVAANNTQEINTILGTAISSSPDINYKVINVSKDDFTVVAERARGGSYSSPRVIASGSSSSGTVFTPTGTSTEKTSEGSGGGGEGGGEVECSGGQQNCSGACTDTQTDSSNCGSCGSVCSSGHTCVSGSCIQSCSAGKTSCGNNCVDLQTDPSHCGSCDKTCHTGQACVSGACSTSCTSGQTLCGSACVNLQTDSSNCGSCGRVCPTGQTCVSGTCTISCSLGQTACGNTCVNLQTDSSNCGSCGRTCPTGQTCVSGTCTLSCTPQETICGSACVNLQTDPANCGSCGKICLPTQICQSGRCYYSGGGEDEALTALHNSTAGSELYDLIKEKNITLEYRDFSGDPGLENVLAYWQQSTNKIVVNASLRGSWSKEAIAAIIGHEAIHADYDYNSAKWIKATLEAHPELKESDLHINRPPGNSIDQEYNAFRRAVTLWRELKGSQTNEDLDGLVSLDDQGEAFFKAAIRRAYASYNLPEY